MIRKAGEAHHNTEAEVRGWLVVALGLIEELDVPGDLRAVAFEKAFQSLSAKQITYEQMQVSPTGLLHSR